MRRRVRVCSEWHCEGADRQADDRASGGTGETFIPAGGRGKLLEYRSAQTLEIILPGLKTAFNTHFHFPLAIDRICPAIWPAAVDSDQLRGVCGERGSIREDR